MKIETLLKKKIPILLLFVIGMVAVVLSGDPDHFLEDILPGPTPTPVKVSPTTTPMVAHDGEFVTVVSMVDGDTIKIEGGEIVRYIGINTPETVAPGRPVECYGREASAKNKELVQGKVVELEKDVSERDRYGRLLRYIWIGDRLINEELVRQGYAQVSTYPPDVKYQERFLAAQRQAREEGKGLWGNVCPTPTPGKHSPVPESTPSGTLLDR